MQAESPQAAGSHYSSTGAAKAARQARSRRSMLPNSLPVHSGALAANPSTQQYYIVRVDAPPGVSTIAADSCPVTIESGPHATLQLALETLQHPRKRAYVLPDIVFLPTNSTVYAMNEVVPQSKPRLVVSSAAVAAARGPNLPPPRQHGGQSPAARSHRRTGSGSRDAHATSTPALWQGPAAAGPALDGLGDLPGGLPWPQAQLGAQQAAAALGQPDALPLPLQLPLLPLPPELLPPLPPLPGQPAAAPPAAVLATPQQPRLQRRAAHAPDADGEAEAEAGDPQSVQQSAQQEAAPERPEQQPEQQSEKQQQQATPPQEQQQQQAQGMELEQHPSPFDAHALPAGGHSPVQQLLRRAAALSRHFEGASSSSGSSMSGQHASAYAVRQLPKFDVTLMEQFLDDQRVLKHEVYELFRQHPDLLVAEEEGLTKEEHRELVRRCLRTIINAGYSPMSFFAKDYASYFKLAELLSLVDLSLTIKLGVQYSLWGGSVFNLGTEKHRRKYLEDIDRLRLPGCFAMTELKHGSNVAGLQTEAILDVRTDEWVVNTPDDGAIKWWIGNAAEDGKAATVFARLKVPSPDGSGALDDHGVHAFVVPLRDEQGQLCGGVEIHDCGYKVGLNGIDNGAIRFTNVRVPRDNLLDRFATVDRSGRYSSPIASSTKRFAATIGELTGGRVGLTAASVGVLKGALTIAVRYSAQRQQFGPPDAPEVAVLDYPSQQAKLMPMLATCYALNFAKNKLVDKYCEMKRTKDEALVADVHSLSAGLKAYTTAYVNTALSICRECCGGHGYAAVNRLGALRSDHDIFQTFEGDNTVLLQQVAALLLKEYQDQFRGSPIAATWSYLKIWARDSLPANPLVTHETDVAHLRDPTFLVRALRYRSARLLHTLAARLRKHSRRLGEFKAWNKCLLHVLALARAHIESVVLTDMLAAVNACNDPDCRRSLKALADLFALDRIYNEIIFRNDDYIAPEKAKAIQRLIEALCSEVRGVAVPLVDAFAIPDHILRAPIGLSTTAVDPYSEYLAAQPSHPLFQVSLGGQSAQRPLTQASAKSFEKLYDGLAGVLAPGGAVAARPTPLGRGLVAEQPIAKGNVLLSVDWANLLCVTDQPKQTGNAFGRRCLEDWQLLHGPLPPLLQRYLLADEGDWFLRLAVWLLWLKRNAQGPWRLYIDLLPKEEMSCLMNYRPEELADFQSPLIEARARVEREQIAALHERLLSSTSGELRVLQLADSLEDTLWAACMVNSRCFSETVDGETVSLVVPCADMANHVLSPNAGYRFVAEADAFQLQALQDIPAGTEACISYGCTHKDSLALLRDYGFVQPGNLNDRVPFNAGDDIASQLAGGGSSQRPSLSAPRLLAAVGLGQFVGDLTPAATAAMGDGDEASAQRRLIACMMSLQPFLRDLGRPAAGAAAAAAGLPPLPEADLARERQSVAALQVQCQALLDRMPTSAAEDEALLSSRQQLGVRQQAAVAARLESKRLILAAADALQRYADTLQ
ncbi:acyl-coenzyme A oxidase peroxisomal isoform B [Chlorella sorokiniana]|uniref:acyl-CoA oxidase n=1 Tax=Chlorella sorokiniana TaxID=3076 RepID=A0A2P6U0A1_CHLSO|nr:acyl-coenzyme A oxidase peroxisomal isoform B [Chlorella sorokiniana]|eukprot:PRW59741.1 acyl-coenzyme A oxidase peroxisomal isoform B [Chlorella sorokiniana]